MKTAAAYARFSSDRQKETSIDTQLEKIADYCKMNEYKLEYTYIDRALTASTDKRPEFLRAISDAKAGIYDILIVYKFDRFARNLENAIVYAKMLEKYDVQLISVNEALPEGASGKLMYNIISSINDFYLENLRQEVKEKTKAVAKQGYFIGGKCPFGFGLVEVKDEYGKIRKKYVINEEEAIHVRDMFRLYATGSTMKYIAEKMTRKTGKKFGVTTIRDMLDNYKYGGYFTYNRGTKGQRHQERDDMIKIPDALPRIIDKETFEKVRERFEGKKKTAFRGTKHEYLLKGQIKCGICGSEMHGDGGKFPRYVCPKAKSKEHEYIAITTKKIERQVKNYLKYSVFRIDKINFEEYAEQVNEAAERRNSIVDEKRSKLQFRKAEIAKQKKNIVEAIMNGFADEDLKDKMNNLKLEEEEIESTLSKLTNKSELYITGHELKERFEIIKNILMSEDATGMKQTLKAIIESVVIYPGGAFEINLKEELPLN